MKQEIQDLSITVDEFQKENEMLNATVDEKIDENLRLDAELLAVVTENERLLTKHILGRFKIACYISLLNCLKIRIIDIENLCAIFEQLCMF